MMINYLTNIKNNKHTLESLPKDQPEQLVIATPSIECITERI